MDDMKELGRQSEYKINCPTASMLDVFDSPSLGPYSVCLESSEFTSLCPITGQPDFSEVVIRYVPKYKCVETKSLKLYLFAYRGEQSFMESICNRIADDLFEVLNPLELQVVMKFHPRGGIRAKLKAERH